MWQCCILDVFYFDRRPRTNSTAAIMLFSLTPLLLLAAVAHASVLSIKSPKLTVLKADKSELRSETYVNSRKQRATLK